MKISFFLCRTLFLFTHTKYKTCGMMTIFYASMCFIAKTTLMLENTCALFFHCQMKCLSHDMEWINFQRPINILKVYQRSVKNLLSWFRIDKLFWWFYIKCCLFQKENFYSVLIIDYATKYWNQRNDMKYL